MKAEEIREGDIVEIDYITEFTKEHINEGKALVIWKGFNNQPLVRKLDTKKPIWTCYEHIARVVGHIDIVGYMDRTLSAEPCEDCISREDALMALTGDITDCTIEEFIARLRDKLSKLPSVTPKEKSEYEHDHEVVKAYTDGQTYILDKIKAEIEQEYKVESEHSYGQGLRRALEIIDKYREVSE